jgi:DNA-binding GntR family transcriptional regulator
VYSRVADENATVDGSVSSGADYSWVDSYRNRFPLKGRGKKSDAVTDLLRGAILDGALEPGSWLREAKLAEMLRVSRTPVRDALRTLAAEGFLELHDNKGAVVVPLTTDDIIELYAVREVLEGLAARLAARRRSRQQLDEMEKVLKRMRQAGDEERFEDLAAYTQDFHRLVRIAARSRYLERSLAQIADAVRRFRHHTYELPGRLPESIEEHVQLADAISRGDAVEAERIATEHIRNLAQLRLKMLMEGY